MSIMPLITLSVSTLQEGIKDIQPHCQLRLDLGFPSTKMIVKKVQHDFVGSCYTALFSFIFKEVSFFFIFIAT